MVAVVSSLFSVFACAQLGANVLLHPASADWGASDEGDGDGTGESPPPGTPLSSWVMEHCWTLMGCVVCVQGQGQRLRRCKRCRDSSALQWCTVSRVSRLAAAAAPSLWATPFSVPHPALENVPLPSPCRCFNQPCIECRLVEWVLSNVDGTQ